jgi:glyoxylase-like metal-dependent hydrolase (beta-lactamase superfamily II)
LEVFHTPGHSPGGVSFLDREARTFFVGDLLYLGKMLLFYPESDPVVFRQSLRLAEEIVVDVDTIYPAHDSVPLVPDDVRAIRAAYETVWAGRTPDGQGTLYGYRTIDHEFGRFSFHLPPGD